MTVTSTTSDVYYDMYDRDIYASPYETFRRLRDEAPLYYNEPYDFWAVARHEDMIKVLQDRETYISGKYIPGIMGTLFSLVDKLVSSLSATVVGVAVSFIGLDSLPTQYDPYTPGMNVVVIVLFCVIPMIAWTATLLAMKNYSLTGEKMKEIQAVNACRRDAVAGGMSLEDAMQKWQTIDQLPAQYRAN